MLSKEGTTQGDPLAMAMYAIGTQPLIRRLDGIAKQVWYADDSAAGSSIERLRRWWDLLKEIGPLYGYIPNGDKTHILAKPEHTEAAKESPHFQPASDRDRVSPAESPSQISALVLSYLVCVLNTCTHTHAHIYTHPHTQTHTYTHTHSHRRMNERTHARIHACNTNTQAFIHEHKSPDTCTNTHK